MNILWALETIQEHTGLGGNTSRGHGQVKIHLECMEAKKVDGETAKGFQNPNNKDFKSYNESIANLSYAIS